MESSTCFAAASEVIKARKQRGQGVRVVLVDLMCSKFLISFPKVSVLSTGPRTIVCLSFFLNSFNVIGLKLSSTDAGKSFGGLNLELASGTGIILHLN